MQFSTPYHELNVSIGNDYPIPTSSRCSILCLIYGTELLHIQVSTLLLAASRSDPAGRPSMVEVEAALNALLSDEVRLRQLSVVAPSSDQGKSSVSFPFCCDEFVLLYWLFMDETVCGGPSNLIFIYTCHASWYIPLCA